MENVSGNLLIRNMQPVTTIYTAKPTSLPEFLQWLDGKQTL